MDQNYKRIQKFIKDDYDKIKLEFIYELIYYLFIFYKANNEFTKVYKISQYLLFDYFLGCTKDEIVGFPINRRQTFVKIRNKEIEVDDIYKLTTDENDKYQIFFSSKPRFLYIKQSTMNDILNNMLYPDCGERTLLNIFNYFLIDNNGRINIESTTFDERLKKFYRKWNYINDIANPRNEYTMKKDWGNVVENIIELKDAGNNFYSNGTYNIHPSKENFIKICRILLNSKEINNFTDILQKLDPSIKSSDIIETIYKSYDNIKYKDITIQCNINHAEFKYGTGKSIIYLLQDYHLIYACINYNFDLNGVEEVNRTYELCIISLSKNVYQIKYVPEKYQTEDLLISVVNRNGYILRFIKNKMKTQSICETAVYNYPEAIKYVPEKFQSAGLWLNIIIENGMLLRYISKKYISQILCDIAVNKNSEAIQFVPEEYQTEGLCLDAVKINGLLLKYIDKKKITELIVKQAIDQIINSTPNKDELFNKISSILIYIPNKYKDNDFYEKLAKINIKFWELHKWG